MPGSCVVSTTVVPRRFTRSRNTRMICSPIRLSSSAVGSSAMSRRLVGDRPGDRDPLLLAPRQLRRAMLHPLLHPDPFEGAFHPLASCSDSGDAQAELDVLVRRHERHEAERLEDEPDLPAPQGVLPPLRHGRQIFAIPQDASFGRLVQSAQDVQKRRLARSRTADQRGDRPLPDRQVDSVQRGHGAAAGAEHAPDAFRPQDDAARRRFCFRSRRFRALRRFRRRVVPRIARPCAVPRFARRRRRKPRSSGGCAIVFIRHDCRPSRMPVHQCTADKIL